MAELTRANYNTATKKQQEFFSDFTVNLDMHPVTHELSRSTNEAAVKRSIRNILLTNRNERPFNPTFGSNISKLLFEPMLPSTADSLKQTISDSISEHEPRAKVSTIEVISDEYNQSYRVNIIFLIVNQKDPVGMTVNLYRVR